jgi:hypothetical protein
MARVSTVTYSNISAVSLTVTVQYDDGTFVTDHPVKVPQTMSMDERIVYDFPERLPDFVFPAIAEILKYTQDYEDHMNSKRIICNAVHPTHAEVRCEEEFGHRIFAENFADSPHFNSFYMRSW